MTVERLSREDRFMLWPDRRWPQVNGALLVLEGGALMDGAGRLRIGPLREAIESRLPLIPRFRQLLYLPPRRLGGPLWVDAQHFEISEHVGEQRVPRPAGQAQLLEVVDELWCRRLDRSRPLWEMWFLTGLPEGRVGLCLKLHHVVADGVAAIATLGALLDAEADAVQPTAPAWIASPPPTSRELFADQLGRWAAGLGRGLAPIAHPLKTLGTVRHTWPALREILAGEPLPATSLEGVVGSGHNLGAIQTSLGMLKAIAHRHGATVNDVFLALITGGLRELFRARGELEEGMLVRISVPVSLRLADRAQARGNLISTMVVPLPVGDGDPLSRLRRIAAETAHRKKIERPSLAIFPMNRLIGPLVLKAVTRQHVNVASTNVPGPERPLYLAGARVLQAFPLLPLIGNEPLAIGALSYAGEFNIMAVGDRELVPDLDIFATGMRQALLALDRQPVAA